MPFREKTRNGITTFKDTDTKTMRNSSIF